MRAERKYFRIWHDDGNIIAEADDHILATIVRGLIYFSITGEIEELPDLSGIERAVYNSMISKMIEDKQRWEANVHWPKDKVS